MNLFTKIFKIKPILRTGFSMFFIMWLSFVYGETPLTHSVTSEESGRVYLYFVIYQEIKIKPKPLVTYYWHRNGQLRSTLGDFSGNILHGNSQEFDKSGRLLRKGTYHYGTKDGEWKSWDRNGDLIQFEKWDRGFLTKRKSYENSKCTIENFRKNQLNGRKIVLSNNREESVEHYKKGVKCLQNKRTLKSYFIIKKQKKQSDVAYNN